MVFFVDIYWSKIRKEGLEAEKEKSLIKNKRNEDVNTPLTN